jgi:hypothetical protein
MKRTFVQCADVLLEEGADPAAPGGAVTLELCGSWDHSGPCRWPHETSADWEGRRGRVRVVFLAADEDERQVRALITRALANGTCVGPDGKLSQWESSDQHAEVPAELDQAWGARMAVSSGTA